jgi:hypothetical protein
MSSSKDRIGQGGPRRRDTDPEHERHNECKTWIGEAFDPTVVDANRIAEQLAALAKRWSRKPATKRPRQA